MLGALPASLYPRYDYKRTIEEARIAAKGDAGISNLTVKTDALSPSELDKLTLREDVTGQGAIREMCNGWERTIWRAQTSPTWSVAGCLGIPEETVAHAVCADPLEGAADYRSLLAGNLQAAIRR